MKKLPILSMAALVAVQTIGTPLIVEQAFARDVTSIKANEIATDFIFDRITMSTGMLGLQFNDTQRRDIRLEEVYVATYKYEEYTTTMVEERLGELGLDRIVDPEWSQTVLLSTMPVDYGAWGSQTLFTSGFPEFLDNRPGILYYAFRVTERDKPDEPVWYRGKVDYRACIRGDTEGAFYDCEGKYNADRTEMVFTRVGTDEVGGEAETWGEVWQKELMNMLSGVRAEIKNWDGDEAARKSFEERLGYIERMSSDAAEVEEVLTEVESVETAIEQRVWDLEHPEDQKTEETGGTEGGSESGDIGTGAGSNTGTGGTGSESGAGSNVGVGVGSGGSIENSGAGGLGDAGSGEAANRGEVLVKEEPKKDPQNVNSGGNGARMTSGQQVASISDGIDIDEVEGQDEKDDDTEVATDVYENEILVPDLNDGELQANRWWIWLLICTTLALGGASYWWMKRAFGKKK